GAGLDELLGVHSAPVHNLCNQPVAKRELRLPLQVKDGAGWRAVRYVCSQPAPIGNGCNSRIIAELQVRDALLALGEQRRGLLCKLADLVNSVGRSGELVAGVVFEAVLPGKNRQHATNVKGVVGGQIALNEVFHYWLAHDRSMYA